jgi:hypothetical protein
MDVGLSQSAKIRSLTDSDMSESNQACY